MTQLTDETVHEDVIPWSLRKLGLSSRAGPREVRSFLSVMDELPARNFAILCGAGVSMVGPSRLPSGADLLRNCLRLLVTAPILHDYRERCIHHPRFDELVPELVLQRVQDILGSLPTELYDDFRVAIPNAVHSWLARASSRGAFIATTNFDELIEAAGMSDGLTVTPLHLHGQVSKHPTLVHTIRRVGRGLEPRVLGEFNRGVRGRILLVLGYSGNDADVMRAVALGKPRNVVWCVRSFSDRAIRNVERLRSSISVEVTVLDLSTASSHSFNKEMAPSPQAPASTVSVEPLRQVEVLIGALLELDEYGVAQRVAEVSDEVDGNGVQRGSILALHTYAARRAGNLEAALVTGRRALKLDSGEHPPLSARLRTELALALLDLEPPDAPSARPLLEESCAILDAVPEPTDVVQALRASAEHNLGFVSEIEGDFDRAIEHYSDALKRKQEIGDLEYQITSERDLAISLRMVGRTEEAAQHRAQFLELATMFLNRYEVADYFLSLGRHLLRRGDLNDARRALSEARGRFADIGGQKRKIREVDDLLGTVPTDDSAEAED